MQEIPRLISDLAMDSSHTLLGFRSVGATLLASRENPLCFPEFLGCLAIELRRCDPLTVAEHCKVLEPSVKADHLIFLDWLEWCVWHLEFRGQRHVPMTAGIALKRRAFRRVIHNLRLLDANPADLRHVDSTLEHLDTLRNSEACLVHPAAFEAWETGAFLEEVLVCSV